MEEQVNESINQQTEQVSIAAQMIEKFGNNKINFWMLAAQLQISCKLPDEEESVQMISYKNTVIMAETDLINNALITDAVSGLQELAIGDAVETFGINANVRIDHIAINSISPLGSGTVAEFYGLNPEQ